MIQSDVFFNDKYMNYKDLMKLYLNSDNKQIVESAKKALSKYPLKSEYEIYGKKTIDLCSTLNDVYPKTETVEMSLPEILKKDYFRYNDKPVTYEQIVD